MGVINVYYIILGCICLSCLLLIFRTLRLAPQQKGWLWIACGVLGLTWVGSLVSLRLAAILGGLTWVLFILLPSLGYRRLNSLLYQQQYEQAYYCALAIRYLHPWDGWWLQAGIIQALWWAQQGNLEQATDKLNRYRHQPSLLTQQAIAILYTMQQDWSGLLNWLEAQPERHTDPTLLLYYYRALGEEGKLHPLLQQLEQYGRVLLEADRRNFNLARMFACAFAGEIDLVRQLFQGSLVIYPETIQKFWLAIAHYGAGDKKTAERQLHDLHDQGNPQFQEAIRHRLQHPPKPAKTLLKPESYPIIARLSRQIQQERRDIPYQSLIIRNSSRQRGLSINRILVALNCLFFGLTLAVSLQGGGDLVLAWGGFIPENVWAGEWWRLFTANFLHIGWLHLLTNMITLYLLGAFAERHLGRWRYLGIYLASGTGVLLCLLGLVTIMQQVDDLSLPRWLVYGLAEIRYPYRMWVGASGAIMGTIGAIAVVLYRGWQRQQSQLALRQLRLLSAVVIFQFSIDISTPYVSFYSHALGLILGIIATLIVTWRNVQIRES